MTREGVFDPSKSGFPGGGLEIDETGGAGGAIGELNEAAGLPVGEDAESSKFTVDGFESSVEFSSFAFSAICRSVFCCRRILSTVKYMASHS